jgi:hypothetical protein
MIVLAQGRWNHLDLHSGCPYRLIVNFIFSVIIMLFFKSLLLLLLGVFLLFEGFMIVREVEFILIMLILLLGWFVYYPTPFHPSIFVIHLHFPLSLDLAMFANLQPSPLSN